MFYLAFFHESFSVLKEAIEIIINMDITEIKITGMVGINPLSTRYKLF